MHTYHATPSDAVPQSWWVRFLPTAVFIACMSPPDDPFSFAEPFLIQQGFLGCSTLPPTHFLREGELYLMYSDIIVFSHGPCFYEVHYVYGTHCIILWLCYASMSCTIQHVLYCSVSYLWANHYFCAKLSRRVWVCLPHLIEVRHYNIKGYLH